MFTKWEKWILTPAFIRRCLVWKNREMFTANGFVTANVWQKRLYNVGIFAIALFILYVMFYTSIMAEFIVSVPSQVVLVAYKCFCVIITFDSFATKTCFLLAGNKIDFKLLCQCVLYVNATECVWFLCLNIVYSF